jgi:hypothetical protein
MTCTDTLFIVGFTLGLVSANWQSFASGVYKLSKFWCRRRNTTTHVFEERAPKIVRPVWENADDSSEEENILEDEKID